MLTTEECPDKLYSLLASLSKAKLVEVLYEALDNMSQYNGRSRFSCIMMALGADETEKGWRLTTEATEALLNDQDAVTDPAPVVTNVDVGGGTAASQSTETKVAVKGILSYEPEFPVSDFQIIERALAKYQDQLDLFDRQIPYAHEVHRVHKEVAKLIKAEQNLGVKK